MRLVGSRLAAGIPFLLVSLCSLPAQAQRPECQSSLSKGENQSERRPLRPEDLTTLRDIGPEFPAGTDPIFAVSPDGTLVAFEMHRADLASNSYCVGIVLVAVHGASSQAPGVLDTGGDLIPSTVEEYGWAELPTGLINSASIQWAPSGKWVAYLKRVNGVTQVWRADVDGVAGSQLTHSARDVEGFLIEGGGTTIVYRARPGLVEVNSRIDREGLTGWHYDMRAYPLRGARPLAPDVVEPEYRTIALADGAERASSGEEVTQFAHARASSSEDGAAANSPDGRSAWIEPEAAQGRITARLAQRVFRCAAIQCSVDRSARLWWSEVQGAVIFVRREGWGDNETAVYSWQPRQHAARLLARTSDKFVECHIAVKDLICLTEASDRPRYLLSIGLSDGRRRTIFDPNPEFVNLERGAVKRLYWKAGRGFQAFADLVYPVGYTPGRRYPLIVVQYRTRGFLRGGTGDEFPIQAFANRGYLVLSTENPSYDQLVGSRGSEDEQDRAFHANFAGRTAILASIEQEIRALIAGGIVDRRRVGITGLSDGSSTVQFAELNSTLFSAGSATGCCWEPNQDAVLGPVIAASLHKQGWPTINDPQQTFWSRMSLIQEAGRAAFPLLLQAADGEFPAALGSYTGLAQAHVPVDLFVFPGEGHVKVQPMHRLAVYRRNLAWFDFWLKNELPTDPVGREEAANWTTMRNEFAARLVSRTAALQGHGGSSVPSGTAAP